LLDFLLIRDGARFYRVEVSYNLFGEYTVLRHWGRRGKAGRTALVWFSNLRDACKAAERWLTQAHRRGYADLGEA
jgi:predicted DNA-binding WGR domain protein